ncbi:DinB family protein [Nonomuraea longicatena]|uniref:DinB family protein n=1 Tax=Nonomuraea longicatena TaxID=83682 RepID=A0ABP4AL47_9ACTN
MSSERADLIQALDRHRDLLKQTVQGLDDQQAALTPTVSTLCLGGLIKHVTLVERGWVRFAVQGTEGLWAPGDDWENGFRMVGDETLASLLAQYDEVAARTTELASTLDLDAAHPLPEAPWFEPGAVWSVRRVLLHVIAETSQHSGHADIIREAIDGRRSMG